MGRGRRNHRYGLLMNIKTNKYRLTAALIVLYLLAASVGAQDAEKPAVEVRTSPAIPLAGSTWTMILLVDHPVPEEVTVYPPPFPDPLFLDQVLKGPYSGSAANSGGTIIEYRFTPRGSGTISLEGFMVDTPLGQTWTAPITMQIRNQDSSGEIARPRLAWEVPVPGLRVGDTAVIGLSMSGWDSRLPPPEPEFFMPPVPEGVILESVKPTPEMEAAGTVLALKLIPLSAAPFTLPRRTLASGRAMFDVPPLRIPVGPAIQAEKGVPVMNNSAPDGILKPEAADGTALFPEFETVTRNHPFLSGIFRGSTENVYRAADALWRQGYRAEALAELRRNERDHPAGLLFVPLRREAELNLGLTGTKDEEFRYTRPAFFPVYFGLALAFCLICLRFPRTSIRKKAGVLCAVFCAAAGLVCLYRLAEGGGSHGHPRSGVLKETDIRKIPDPSGEITGRVGEGRPVRLSPGAEKTGPWIWIAGYDNDETSGWVSREDIILY
jgi:hypothetical protein